MPNVVYNAFKMNLTSGNVNLNTDTVSMLLVSGAYTFSHTHEVTGDLSSEIVSAGYDLGGVPLANPSVTLDGVDDEVVLDADDVVLSGLTTDLQYAIVYVSGASNATSYLIGQVDLGAQSLSNTDLTIAWNSEGIFNLM